MWANLLIILAALAKPMGDLVEWLLHLGKKSDSEILKGNQDAKDKFDETGRPK